MAKAKITEPKKELEREYIVPLRKAWLKVPEYKRTNKAIKAIKEFLVRHMKIYDKDLKKIKIDTILNNEIRFRGIRKPPAKIKVKAIKFDNGIVKVELVELPEHLKFAKAREEKQEVKEKEKEEKKEKKEEREEKIEEEKLEEKKLEEEIEEEKIETEEIKEKKESSREEGLMLAKKQAKESKHTAKDKRVQVQRVALRK